MKYIILTVTFPLVVMGRCFLSKNTFSCSGIKFGDFLNEFYYITSEENNFSVDEISIVNSSFNLIEYIPNFTNKNLKIIKFRNSSIEVIKEEAFDELIDLEILDLSVNTLKNILFVKSLPNLLQYLYLNNNNITYLDNVFGRLGKLSHLDLSSNNIGIVDFSNVCRINYLILNNNNIEVLIPPIEACQIVYLDLSYNKLTQFSEVKLQIFPLYLNMSYNNVNVIELTGNKYSLNLSGTDLRNISLTGFPQLAKSELILQNNNIHIFDNNTFNFSDDGSLYTKYYTSIDLSNSSITDIGDYKFSEMHINILNLSNNFIVNLRKKLFDQSYINVLDISNAQVEHIASDTFENLYSEKVILSKNNLTKIKGLFSYITVDTLDLSSNPLTSISNFTFLKVHNLVELNFSNCLIEKMDTGAFIGLNLLRVLDLSNNKFYTIESNTFNNLPLTSINLSGNKINSIRSKAFNSLSTFKKINLAGLKINNLEPMAFHNLSQVEIIDLKNNNITVIPQELFYRMDKLAAIYLEGNTITSLNPFPNRIKFRLLSLSYKGILKPNQIMNLSLKHLHIIHSELTTLKSNTFSALYNLEELHFNKTKVIYVEPGALSGLYKLKYLDTKNLFQHTRIIEQSFFKDLKSLPKLDLSDLKLESIESKSFFNMKRLEKLLLQKNNLKHLKRRSFYGLVNLKFLDLSYNNLSNWDEKTFKGLDNLEVLYLQFNNLNEIRSRTLFESLVNLRQLNLSFSSISSLNIKSFSGLENLQHLYLNNNSINELPTGIFQYLISLKSLILSYNKLQYLQIGVLSNLKSLEVIDFSNNELVHLEYVDVFFSLKLLKIILLDNNYLKQFDFSRLLVNLKEIKYVGISENKWKCESLSLIIETLNNKTVDYTPRNPVYNNDNIDGIGCVDICKFVYCSHEDAEQNLHY